MSPDLVATQPEFSVLVPAILGVGLIFTLGHDAFHRLRAGRRFLRRSRIEGHTTGQWVTGGREAATADHIGLRSRWTYLLVGASCLGMGIYLTIGAWANFFGFTPWSDNIAWIAILLQGAAFGFATAGVYLLAVAVWYQNPPTQTRPLLTRTSLSKTPDVQSRQMVGARPARVERIRLLGTHHVTDRLAFAARLAAVVWSLVAFTLFVVLAELGQFPQAEGGLSLERTLAQPLQIALLVLIAIGLLMAWRWEAVGAGVMAAAGAALAIVASIQYPPMVAIGVALMFVVPAFLHWLAWQRDRGMVHIGSLFLITAAIVSLVAVGAESSYARYFGPQHPESETVALVDSPVQWIWAGGTTMTRTSVVARIHPDRNSARIAISESADLAGARFTPISPVNEGNHFVVRAHFDELKPDTRYFYSVEVDGQLDRVRSGTVQTFPVGASDFTFVFASCARTGSNGSVFDTIRKTDPLVYLQLGDFHYANIDYDDQSLFRDALDQSLKATSQSALYRSTSTGYVWDDHDYSGNDANATAPSRPAAEAVYRQYVPHYELSGDTNSGPIFQAFSVGRVRFLITDTRSTRTPQEAVDNDQKYLIGKEQERWFLAELAAARERDGVVVWANSVPWIDEAQVGGDSWGGYTSQRTRLANLVASYGLADRLVMVSGDAHMVALDDGTNSNYATTADSAGRAFPVFQAAALDRLGGTKGGPYSGGAYPGAGQFGMVRVADSGGNTVAVTFEGRTWDDQVLVEQTFNLRARP